MRPISWKKRFKIWLYNFYPPYIGAGIRIKKIAKDLTSFEVEMKLSFYNQNYVGVHFGGSLYSMCDPFFMLILLETLGSDYIVWDKIGSMSFIKPGKGKVKARFFIPEEEIQRIKTEIEVKRKGEFHFTTNVLDESNSVVATLDKTIYIRKRGKLPIQNV
ncbi:putative thioesterase [Leptospira ellinghausenii]|uniref:Putative thioesterase n=1 Tax=Leptospira ellinghausenii TaxID=1917822 RepID=A0A2P2DF11_9LEPT|nr:putative thioesterase [Leptospira ellinghausenii]